jgi:uroporphyrin-III C-methyltransferase
MSNEKEQDKDKEVKAGGKAAETGGAPPKAGQAAESGASATKPGGASAQGKKGAEGSSRRKEAAKTAAPEKRKESGGEDTGVAKPVAPAAPPTAAARSGGNGGRAQTAALLIATLAFLLSLGVGGALFYLWQDAEDARADQLLRMERLAAELEARDQRLARLEDSLEREASARETLAGRTEARLATAEQGLTRLQDRTTRQERGWQVAEIKHLQRMASHRLRLMDDPEGARRALQAADELLADLGDPRLMPVREALAGEIRALEDMPRADIPGIALRLERLVVELRPLPLRGQARVDTGAQELIAGAPVDPDAPWWARAYGELRSALAEHISVRRHGEPLRALPDAETELFLRQLLALRLEAARVAALRMDDAQYQRSLEGAITLLDDHFDSEAASAIRGRLTDLRSVTLRPEPPDISGSFTRLDELEG